MLVLTRRIHESICIGNDIRLTVLSVEGRQVRIGIEAPKEVTIHRAELYARLNPESAWDDFPPEELTKSE